MNQIQYSASAMHIVNRRNVAAYFVETREIADAYFIDDHLNTWLQGGRSQFYGANISLDLTRAGISDEERIKRGTLSFELRMNGNSCIGQKRKVPLVAGEWRLAA